MPRGSRRLVCAFWRGIHLLFAALRARREIDGERVWWQIVIIVTTKFADRFAASGNTVCPGGISTGKQILGFLESGFQASPSGATIVTPCLIQI